MRKHKIFSHTAASRIKDSNRIKLIPAKDESGLDKQ